MLLVEPEVRRRRTANPTDICGECGGTVQRDLVVPVLEQPQTDHRAERVAGTGLALMVVAPIVFLVGCSLLLAVAAGPVFDLVEAAAVQLLEPAAYVDAVRGPGGEW